MLAACTAVGIHIVGGFQSGFFFSPCVWLSEAGLWAAAGYSCKLAVLKFVDERVHQLWLTILVYLWWFCRWVSHGKLDIQESREEDPLLVDGFPSAWCKWMCKSHELNIPGAFLLSIDRGAGHLSMPESRHLYVCGILLTHTAYTLSRHAQVGIVVT